MVELGSSRDKQRGLLVGQLATCFPRAQNILQMLSRGFAPDHAGEAYSAPPDSLAEFAAASRRGAMIENYRESRRVTLTSLLVYPLDSQWQGSQ